MKIEDLLAKSCELCDNKSLINHTKMVTNFGLFAGNIIFNEIDNINKSKENFLKELGIALITHDIGKCADEYQELFKKKHIIFDSDGSESLSNKSITITHNVYSWAFLNNCLNNLHVKKYNPITSSVLFHHVVYENVNNMTASKIMSNLSRDNINVFNEFYSYMKNYLKETFNFDYSNNFDIVDESEYKKLISDEKLFGEINNFSREEIINDSKASLMRACVILADRCVSSDKYNNKKILENDIEYMSSVFDSFTKTNKDLNNVNLIECGYDINRMDLQFHIVNDLIPQNNHNVIGASAGLGKTLIGILNFFTEKKKTIWVTPRNVIADGTYNSIIKELEKMKQTDVNVALYRSGEIIDSNFNATEENLLECDILVTNIDSILNRIVKNNVAHTLFNMYSSNIIIDEYHELFCNKPLFPAFIRLMFARTFYTKSKTLLLSATPLDLNCFFGETKLIKYYTINDIPIHNGEMDVNIKLIELDDIINLNVENKDSFVIANTIKQSQNLFEKYIDDKESLLIHTRFPQTNRKKIEKKIYQSHDKNSNVTNRNLIVGTNIIGVGLDISAKNIYDFVISPENTIQRGCGRGGRFNEVEYNSNINYYICTLNNSKGNKKLINEIFDTELYNKWINKLKKFDGKTIKKKDLYKLYYEFYEENKEYVTDLYFRFFKEGSEELSEMKLFSSKKKKNTNLKTICNGLSYRGYGENIFVTAKNENGEWCESICVNRNHLKDETNADRNVKGRKEYIRTNENYPNKYELKKYGIEYNSDYNKENLFNIALRSDRPLPLFNYVFNERLGLISIGSSDEDSDED